jgi:hypothetical protein
VIGVQTFTWLTYPATGAAWQCPEAAVPAWLARGWELLDTPPAEPDTTKDPEPAQVAPAAEPVSDAEPSTQDAEVASEPEELT